MLPCTWPNTNLAQRPLFAGRFVKDHQAEPSTSPKVSTLNRLGSIPAELRGLIHSRRRSYHRQRILLAMINISAGIFFR